MTTASDDQTAELVLGWAAYARGGALHRARLEQDWYESEREEAPRSDRGDAEEPRG